jgi:hypothetical protein
METLFDVYVCYFQNLRHIMFREGANVLNSMVIELSKWYEIRAEGKRLSIALRTVPAGFPL